MLYSAKENKKCTLKRTKSSLKVGIKISCTLIDDADFVNLTQYVEPNLINRSK